MVWNLGAAWPNRRLIFGLLIPGALHFSSPAVAQESDLAIAQGTPALCQPASFAAYPRTAAARTDAAMELYGASLSACSPETLIALLADPSEAVRDAAAVLLAQMGEAAVEPLLAKLVLTGEPERDVGHEGLDGEDRNSGAKGSDYVAWALIHSDAPIDARLAQRLRETLTPLAEAQLREESDETDHVLRPDLVLQYVLGSREAPDPEVAIGLFREADPRLEEVGASMICKADVIPDALEADLARLLQKSGKAQRMLDTNFPCRSIVWKRQARRLLANSRDQELRKSAVLALNSDPTNEESLIAAIRRDRSADVRREAIRHLGSFHRLSVTATGTLAQFVAGRDANLRADALEALDDVDDIDWSMKDLARLARLICRADRDLPEDDVQVLGRLLARANDANALAAVKSCVVERIDQGLLTEALPLLDALDAAAQDKHLPEAVLSRAIEMAKLDDVETLIKATVPLFADPGSARAALARLLRDGLERKRAIEAALPGADSSAIDSEYASAAETVLSTLIGALGANGESAVQPLEMASSDALTIRRKCKALDWALDSDDRSLAASQLALAYDRWCKAAARRDQRFALAELPGLRRDVQVALEKSKSADAVYETFYTARIAGSLNEAEVLLALIGWPEMAESELLNEQSWRLARTDAKFAAALAEHLRPASWYRIASFVDTHGSYGRTPASLPFAEAGQLALDWLRNLAAGAVQPQGETDEISDTVQALLSWASGPEPEIDSVLRSLLVHPHSAIRFGAIKRAQGSALLAADRDTWARLLCDPDPIVVDAAATYVVESGAFEDLWDLASRLAIRAGLASQFSDFVDDIAGTVRSDASSIVVTGGGAAPLPPFPWPPSSYTNKARFGSDIELNLLGNATTTLGQIDKRLRVALRKVDPNFEVGLFGVPGGFAMMTKTEQIDELGRPLANRWSSIRRPPGSLSEYLVDLLISPPGYYRSIVFVITDAADFGSSKKVVPNFRAGASTLPDSLKSVKLGDRSAFVLVYAFKKRDTGVPRPYPNVSAANHLQRAGVLSRLEQ